MPHVINFDGPKTSSAVITSSTLNGAYGQAHDLADSSSLRLFNKDEFKLNGEGYETRWDKFAKTTKTFAEASACVGTGVGTIGMFLPDVLTGRGKMRPEGERASFMDEGILGNGGRFATALTSGTAEVAGAGVGGLGALITYPAKSASSKSSAEWFEGGASGGALVGGKGAAHIVGAPVGIALDAVRLPSVAVKYALAGVGAIVGGTIGVFAGGVRAIINR